MEIVEVNAYPLRTDVEHPCWTAHEYYDVATLTLVEVKTADGTTGYGESRGRDQHLVCEYVETFADVLVGKDALGHTTHWETLLSTTSPRPGGLGDWDGLPGPLPRGHRPQIMSALGALDIALWDIKGKAADVPVYRLLGGTDADVFTYATGGLYNDGEPLTAGADELAGFVDDGFDAVKLKTGALSLADELTRVSETRNAIGPETQLMLDLNAPFTATECIEFAKAVEPYDIVWLEEPLRWYLQPDDFLRAANGSPIPLAHGERLMHRFRTREFIDSGAVQFVQFDATRYGGFTEAHRIAQYADQRGVQVVPHGAPYIHGHLVAALGESGFAAERVATTGFRPIPDTIYTDAIVIEDGTLQLPDEPGFGLEIEWDRVDDLLVDDLG